MFSVSYPCDSAPHTFSLLASRMGAKHQTLDVPWRLDAGGLELLASQLEEAAMAMAEQARLSPEKAEAGIRRAIASSNRARSYLLDIAELRARRPCPLSGKELPGQLSMLTSALGTPEGELFFKDLRDEMAERSRVPGEPAGERLRLLWMHLRPYYENEIPDWLEDFGARVVCDEFSYCWWEEMDPDDPYRSLARRLGSYFGVGPVENRAETMLRLAREYQVDGAVHFNHWGCRQSTGGSPVIRDRLLAAGIPCLILEGDCVDEREYQEGQTRTRLETFLSSL
jgi:benzoyl-CoA reductase/2-hydroxyglutaryl-CoA dehydratase subunit BcrC/BadD/HgdB